MAAQLDNMTVSDISLTKSVHPAFVILMNSKLGYVKH